MILEHSDGQKAFQQQDSAFAAERIAPAAAAIDADGRYPRELVGEMAERGLLGVTIAPEWGGRGQDYVSYALALEAVARAIERARRALRPSAKPASPPRLPTTR